MHFATTAQYPVKGRRARQVNPLIRLAGHDLLRRQICIPRMMTSIPYLLSSSALRRFDGASLTAAGRPSSGRFCQRRGLALRKNSPHLSLHRHQDDFLEGVTTILPLRSAIGDADASRNG